MFRFKVSVLTSGFGLVSENSSHKTHQVNTKQTVHCRAENEYMTRDKVTKGSNK